MLPIYELHQSEIQYTQIQSIARAVTDIPDGHRHCLNWLDRDLCLYPTLS